MACRGNLDMSALNDETAVVVDDLRKVIAECETRLARGRRKSRKSHTEVTHAQALKAQALLEVTLNSLKRTLYQIEKSHEVVATSHTLLEKMEQDKRHRVDQTRHRKKLPLCV